MGRYKGTGFVYFAMIMYGPEREELGEIKIGFSTNPRARLSALKSAASDHIEFELVVAGTIEDERALHKRFAKQRIRREWFRYDDELCNFVEEVVDAQAALKAFRGPGDEKPTLNECLEYCDGTPLLYKITESFLEKTRRHV